MLLTMEMLLWQSTHSHPLQLTHSDTASSFIFISRYNYIASQWGQQRWPVQKSVAQILINTVFGKLVPKNFAVIFANVIDIVMSKWPFWRFSTEFTNVIARDVKVIKLMKTVLFYDLALIFLVQCIVALHWGSPSVSWNPLGSLCPKESLRSKIQSTHV